VCFFHKIFLATLYYSILGLFYIVLPVFDTRLVFVSLKYAFYLFFKGLQWETLLILPL